MVLVEDHGRREIDLSKVGKSVLTGPVIPLGDCLKEPSGFFLTSSSKLTTY